MFKWRNILIGSLLMASTIGCAYAASPNDSTDPPTTPIVDSAGNNWTIIGGVVKKNGANAGTSYSVTELAIVNNVIWQYNGSDWYSWNSTGNKWYTTPPKGGTPNSPLPTCTPSANDSTDPSTTPILDSSCNSWTLSGGVVYENGSAAGVSYSVTEMAYVSGVIWQFNGTDWYSWNPSGNSWYTTPPQGGTPTSPLPGSGGGSGSFTAANGTITGPSGSAFVARGVNMYPGDVQAACTTSSCAGITGAFPNINFVRYADGCGMTLSGDCPPYATASYSTPAQMETYVNYLTSLGIVVEIEDHNDNQTVLTGTALTNELNFYTAWATAEKSNPYVWFGTMNEPGSGDSAQEVSIYNAIRGTGNTNPILLETTGGGGPSGFGQNGLTASSYTSMTNVIWDQHFYGWMPNYSTSQTTINSTLSSMISADKAFVTGGSEGTIPVLIAEYGNSTDGSTVDADGSQIVTGAATSGYGFVAWGWDPGGAGDDLLNSPYTGGASELTSYGSEVAGYIN